MLFPPGYSINVLQLINFLMFWGQTQNYYSDTKILFSTGTITTTWLKMGKWVTKCSIETLKSAPCTPEFCQLRKNLPPGRYTHRYVGGRQAVGPPPGRLGPFLGKEEGVGPPQTQLEGAQSNIEEGVWPPLGWL